MVTTARTGVTTYATPSEREIVITRVVDAPRHLVFDAFTNPARVPKWLTGPEGVTMPVCEIDLRPGGRWRYVYRMPDGGEMTLQGTFREVTPPERVVHTETWGPGWPETVNTLALGEAGGQTTITLTLLYPSKEARDAALQSGMKDGMEQGFARLDELLAGLA
jgi:uncharacterized protein YndB with AHSA1/START domain